MKCPAVSRLLIACAAVFCCIASPAFLMHPAPVTDPVAAYYDTSLDALIQELRHTASTIPGADKKTTRTCFHLLRIKYKHVGFLLQYLNTRADRQLNGPDLLRIEEENPADSLKPHGLQVIERCIYGANETDTLTLQQELAAMQQSVAALRNEPDRGYQFTATRVFSAMRTGIYGIITLDVTGFDAPLSRDGIAGARAALEGIRTVFLLYPQSTYRSAGNVRSHTLKKFDAAIHYLAAHPSFAGINRMELIRNYLDPLSAALTDCARAAGAIDPAERTALNMQAPHLFAADIFNTAFFAPNDQYLPTPERIALGRALFYDTRLSGNNHRSCASCHQARKGFTDGLAKARNIAGAGTILRNTPTLLNSSLQTRQFYDLRTDKLENQLSDVVHSTSEMAGSLAAAAQWMMRDTAYNKAFGKAYPAAHHTIDPYHIANALSSYVRSLIALNSPFDQYMRGTSRDYPATAIRGFNLFMGKAACGTCHYAPLFNGQVPPLFSDAEAEVLGVPEADRPGAHIDLDEGRMRYTRLPLHRYAFKTSTVRNAAITAPYMHNGAFKSLQAVIGFYDKGGAAGLGIDLPNQTLPAAQLHLTARERGDIAAFLRSLTDTAAGY